MIEILRRAALVVGVYGAIVVFLDARPGLVEVAVVDFAAEQARRPRWREDSRVPLAQYVAERTADRRGQVDAEAWTALADAVRQAGSGGSAWLLPTDGRLRVLEPTLGRARRLLYLERAGVEGSAWLRVQWRPGNEARDAPAAMRRPLRSHWPWWVLGGLLVYMLLPRRPRGEDTIAYDLMPAVVMPDVLGLLLGGTFFTLGLVIPRAIADDGRMLVPELWPLYAVFGLFVLLAWCIHAASAHYGAFRLRISDEALTLIKLFDQRTIRIEDIVEARPVLRRAPKWLRTLMWIGSLLNPRATGQALILSARADPELLVCEADGRETRILLTALGGGERLRAVLGERLVEPD